MEFQFAKLFRKLFVCGCWENENNIIKKYIEKILYSIRKKLPLPYFLYQPASFYLYMLRWLKVKSWIVHTFVNCTCINSQIVCRRLWLSWKYMYMLVIFLWIFSVSNFIIQSYSCKQTDSLLAVWLQFSIVSCMCEKSLFTSMYGWILEWESINVSHLNLVHLLSVSFKHHVNTYLSLSSFQFIWMYIRYKLRTSIN